LDAEQAPKKRGEATLLTSNVETAYYIAFGAHGPRALPPPGEGWRVAGYTALGMGVSFALFVAIRLFAKGSPGTMNKEYQEASNEFLKVCYVFPYYLTHLTSLLLSASLNRGEGRVAIISGNGD
jgi:hypothetical protein